MRAELSRRCGSHNAEESTTKRTQSGEQERVARGGGRGLYVKGGRARCYLACSPDEISASSFRPSFPLLPRSAPPSLPSSYAFFLFCFYLPALSPAYRISPRRSCKAKTFSARHCQTFDCVGISALLSPPPLPPLAFFSSYLNLSFFSWFFFFHTSLVFFIYLF